MYQKSERNSSSGDYRIGASAGFLLDVPMQKAEAFNPESIL